MRVLHKCEIGAVPGGRPWLVVSRFPKIATLNDWPQERLVTLNHFLEREQAIAQPERDFATRKATESSFSRGIRTWGRRRVPAA